VGKVIRIEPAAAASAVIWIEVEPRVEVWPDARLSKKTRGVEGTFYLELEPGTASAGRRLERGDRITNVIERVTADDLLKRLGAP
jgi:ABC-type transporter Mla subunit MlaD